MKNISKIAAMLLIGGSFVIQSCDGVFDDLAINPNQPSMGAYFTTPEAVNDAVLTMYGYVSTQRSLGASGSKTQIIRSDESIIQFRLWKTRYVWRNLECKLLYY